MQWVGLGMVQIGQLASMVVKTGHDLGVKSSFMLLVLELGQIITSFSRLALIKYLKIRSTIPFGEFSVF
jgi:hypothetical protein